MRVRSSVLGGGMIAVGLALAVGAPLVASASGRSVVPGAVKLDETKPPTLSAVQRQEAISLLGRDTALQLLTGGQPYKVLEVGPWSSGGKLAGAAIRLDLGGVRILTGLWPGISYDPLGGTDAPHQLGVAAATVEASRLSVLVDFDTRRVARVLPEPAERPHGVEPPPDWSKAPPSALGGR